MFCILFFVFGFSQALATLKTPVDLGHPLDSNTVYWYASDVFNLTVASQQDTPYWFIAKKISTGEHGGTHMDAPYHFRKDGWKVGDIPLDRLTVQGIVLDLKKEAANNSDFEVTADHLIKWEKKYGPLPKPVVVLADFGWAWRYSNRTAYFGGPNESSFHFPGYSKSAAIWMVNTGKVVGVGTDTPSIDPGKDTDFNSHRVLNGQNIYLLENLALAKANLPARDFQLTIMPMKISEGSGSPVRVIAYPYNPARSLHKKIMLWMSTMWDTFGQKFKDFRNLF